MAISLKTSKNRNKIIQELYNKEKFGEFFRFLLISIINTEPNNLYIYIYIYIYK